MVSKIHPKQVVDSYWKASEKKQREQAPALVCEGLSGGLGWGWTGLQGTNGQLCAQT